MIPEQFRLIATSAALVRAAGPAGAIWVGNAISAQEWSSKEHPDDAGWWHATKAEIEERTGLSDEMQETARRRLRDAGVLEERRGVLKRGASLATIWYRLDLARLSAIVYRETRQTDAGNPGKRAPENPANDHTSGNTSENTSLKQPPKPPKGGRGRERKPFDPGEFDHLIPVELARSGEFVEAWHTWMADRRERKQAVTEAAALLQLKRLNTEAGSPEAAVGWIRNAIEKGWRGLYRPTESSPTRARPNSPTFRTAADKALANQLARKGSHGTRTNLDNATDPGW